MSNEKNCPECGAAIPAETPEALCPACLLRRGFETQTGGGAAAASNVPPPTPEALASRFPQLEIIELLGRGGMGVVYKARHRGLDRWVALKILPASADHDPAFAERFSREARALARLDHPHIVTVYDSGEADGLFYFIMEYVDGATLRQILAAGGMKPEQALAIVPQICEALQYAHDQGVVHRDIKPENILVDKSGRVKIADFGIAKIVGWEASDFTLTALGEVMGTPAYMAPEQVEHPSAVDHRADIYSLGVVFYQMLTGELPLGRFAPPSRKVQIDVRLDEVVLRTLEKEPDLRYQQAGEVKTEVETIAGTPGHRAPAPVPAADGWGWNAPVNYRSKTTLWGLPLIHIAQGIDPATGRVRVARGIIAIGGIAQGGIAIGGLALGGIACGGLALGGVAFGGFGLGLLALAGMALGVAAAWGGLAIAPVSMGGTAMGYYARGDWAAGMHIWDATTKDPEAVQFFQGSWAQNLSGHLQVASLVIGFLIFAVSSGAVIWAMSRAVARKPGDSRRRWIQLAVVLLLLTAFGINAAVSWNVIQQRRKKGPASASEPSPVVRQALENLPFGQVIERVVPREGATVGRYFISFKTGKILTPPPELSDEKGWNEWKIQNSVDAGAEEADGPRLWSYEVGGCKFLKISTERWDNITAAEVKGELQSGQLDGAADTHTPDGKQPATTTFLFKTREGLMGVLQIIGFDNNKRGVKIRYKLVQDEVQSSDLKQRAAAFVDLLSKGDFAQARAGFDLTMSGAMSEEALAALWKQLEANGGKFQGHDAPRQEAFAGYQIVYVPCRWERVRLDLKVVYNQSGQISGLWIVSPGDSMSGKAPLSR